MDDAYINFINVQKMLLESTKLLRQLFLNVWKDIYHNDWTDDLEAAKYFLKSTGKDIRDKCKKLQQEQLDRGNSNDWDITLINTILSSYPFNKSQSTPHKDIQTIAKLRNKISHCSNMILSDEEYEKIFEELGQALRSLGASKELIDKLIENKNKKMVSNIQTNKTATLTKNQANEEFQNKNYTRAIDLYTSALATSDLSNQEVGILFCNRSLAYLKQYENTKDERDIYRALSDANQTCSYYPIWYKGYARLGEIYYQLNELNESKDNYEKALAFDTTNEEIKNSLAFVKNEIGIQQRHEHLYESFLPISSIEERDDMVFKRVQEKGELNNTSDGDIARALKNTKEVMEKVDPSVKDVWKGHEYQVGSKNVKQSYEMAAKYYSKAAHNNNAEGMYNLALLTMKGLGVKRDYNTAISLLKEAANQEPFRKLFGSKMPNTGVAEAQHSLGLAYQQGIYVSKDETIAAIWYGLSAENGYPNAATNIGLLYLNGTGVEKDIRQAEKLFMLAHERGDPNGSINLVGLYVEDNDPDRALMWHERSLQTKSIYPKTRDESVRKTIIELKKINNLHDSQKSETKSYIEFMKKTMNTINSLKSCNSARTSTKRFYDPNMLTKYAGKGSITARKMLDAMSHFYKALYMLEGQNLNIDDFIANLAYGYKTEEIVCRTPYSVVEKILSIVENILHDNKNQQSDIDYQARICFINLNCGDTKFILSFLNSTLKIYPNDSILYELRASSYGFLAQYENALKDLKKVMQLNPNNYDAIYYIGVALRLFSTEKIPLEITKSKDSKNTEETLLEAIQFYELFLFKAPIDHRKIPESYYSIAVCWKYKCALSKDISVMHDTLKKVKFYYNKGLESEKDQLPCFLPYESNNKIILDSFLKLLTESKSQNMLNNQMCYVETENTNMLDFKRIDIIRTHRNCLKENKKLDPKKVFKITYKPSKRQVMPSSLIGLKEVFLRDIDFSKDHIMNGYVLTVTNFDVPIIGVFPSVHFVVKDENNFVNRSSIYNMGNDFESIREKFPIGSVFSIINPYIRLSTDGKPIIRVDDPNTIIFSGKIIENMCRYCGKADSKYSCSKCKVAKYCSKECQTNDWKILNHKYICIS